MSEITFPDGFLWGAATSSHQVEGNNRNNDWWAYEQAGKLPFPSGDCCRHYDLFEEDFDLAQSLGHNSHRFSIEWSRVEPAPGAWDREAVDHYGAVIKALRDRDLEPVVTLHHFTAPAWFTDRGGWERSDSPRLFARFIAHMLEQLDPPVTFWLTINEPTVYVQQSYVNGSWPPQKRRAWRQAACALRNRARAHGAGYRVITAARPGSQVGFAHNALLMEPCDAQRFRDRLATRLRDFVFNHLFFLLIERPVDALDFIGLNYYTRCSVRSCTGPLSVLLGRACKTKHHPHQGVYSDIGWEVYPRGLAKVLMEFSERGLPLMVTENGIATVDDERRREFLRDHLAALAEAIKQGANVIGYLHWSLMDNFEWDMGTAPKFGLVAVDYDTQQRNPRGSANLFAQQCRGEQLTKTSQ